MKRLALFGFLLLAACGETRPIDRPDLLPPLAHDYKAQIVGWAKGFFQNPAGLRGARISAPVPVEESTRTPMWLVCVEVDVPGPDGGLLGPQRFGFGFLSGSMLSAPQRRSSFTLASADCDKVPLAWRPFPELERIRPAAPPRR